MAKNTRNSNAQDGSIHSAPAAISTGPMTASQSMDMMKEEARTEPVDDAGQGGGGNDHPSDTSLPVASMLGTQLTTVMVPAESGKSKEFPIESNMKTIAEAKQEIYEKSDTSITPATLSSSELEILNRDPFANTQSAGIAAVSGALSEAFTERAGSLQIKESSSNSRASTNPATLSSHSVQNTSSLSSDTGLSSLFSSSHVELPALSKEALSASSDYGTSTYTDNSILLPQDINIAELNSSSNHTSFSNIEKNINESVLDPAGPKTTLQDTQQNQASQFFMKNINHAPSASMDNFTLNEDAATSISKEILLNNDIDSDGNTLVITSIGTAAHGALSFDPVTGLIIYTPVANYNGLDSFTYTITDGRGAESTAVVNLTISPENDVPVVINESFTINEDNALAVTASSLLANDSDVDGNTLALTSVQGATHGAVSLVGGVVTFTPEANYNGAASFTYTVSDGQGGNVNGVVNLTISAVNDTPVVINESFTINEDNALVVTASSLLANDTDVDGNTLTLTSVQGATHGAVSLVGGVVTFTPEANYSGAASFTYTVSDSQGGNVNGVVNLTVSPVNDAPTSINDNFILNEDATTNFTANQLLGNDSDVDGNTLVITSVQSASHGSVNLSGNTITFTPAANYSGPASFTYNISDGSGGSSSATVNLTINPINDIPVQIANTFTGAFGASTIIPISSLVSDIETSTWAAGNVSVSLANPALGTVSYNASTQNITFTPNAGVAGTVGIIFTVTDTSDGTSAATSLSSTANINIPSQIANIIISVNEQAAATPTYGGSDTYTAYGPGIYASNYTISGSMMNTSGITSTDAIRLNYANANSVTVNETVGTIRNMQATSLGAGTVILGSAGGTIDHMDVSLGGTTSSVVTLTGRMTSGTITTGTGNDTVNVTMGTTASGISNILGINTHAGNDSITIKAGGNTSSIINIDAGSGNDTINLTTANFNTATINTGTGNDALSLSAGGNTSRNLSIDMGTGNDTVTLTSGTYSTASVNAGDGADLIYTGIGQNTVLAGSGSDYIKTTTGTDNISGESGHDLIFVSTGNDAYSGGGGNDTFIFTSNLTAGFSQTISGGTQYDVIRLPNASGWTITIGGNSYTNSSADITNLNEASGTITFTTGGSTVAFSGIDDFVWKGTYTESNSGSLTGSSSNDDLLIGGAANQTISSNNSATGDYLYGLGGNDTLTGGTGADRLYGGTGNDSINAMNGNDFIYDDQGNDVYKGNAGNDTFIFDTSNASDVDYAYGNLIGGTGAAGQVGTGGAGTDILTLSNTANWTISVGSNTYTNASAFISGTNLSGQVTYNDGSGHIVNFYDMETINWS